MLPFVPPIALTPSEYELAVKEILDAAGETLLSYQSAHQPKVAECCKRATTSMMLLAIETCDFGLNAQTDTTKAFHQRRQNLLHREFVLARCQCYGWHEGEHLNPNVRVERARRSLARPLSNARLGCVITRFKLFQNTLKIRGSLFRHIGLAIQAWRLVAPPESSWRTRTLYP